MTQIASTAAAARKTANKTAPAKPAAKPAATTAPAAKAAKAVKAAKATTNVKASPVVKQKVVASKAKPAAAPAAQAKPKIKLVRDSFTMPRGDYELIAQLKTRTLGLQRATKKSELLRAGLHALAALSDKQLLVALNALTPLKAGRPKAG